MGERPPPDPVDYDLVIIGCGIYGSQVARTYLSIRPGRRVAIFESSKTIGSVWSRGKSQPVLASNLIDAFYTT